MGQIKFIISLIMISLFTIAMITFGINMANDNDSFYSIDDDPELNALYSGVKTNTSAFITASDSSYSSILNSTISPDSGTAQSTAPFALTPLSVLGVMKGILLVAYTKIFGSGNGFRIFLTTFIGVLIFMMGLYLYKTLRGQPD